MSPILLASLAILAMFILILMHVPIGFAMAAVGIIGFGLMTSFGAGLSLVASEAASNMSNMDLSVIPLFVLMGNFAAASGISTDMYNLAQAFIGHRRGGLAMATVGGCGLFGAVSGSSIATTVTFGRVALPEMIDRGYAPTLATGCIAGGGTLGTLVPPSIILVIYSILAEQFIIELFVAAVVPAIITILLYFLAIFIYVRIKPDAGPSGPKASWSQRKKVILQSWGAITLIGAIAVGIYGGIFTVIEAAALGAILSLLMVLIRGKMTLSVFWEALASTAATTGMIYFILIGSSIFNYFIVISHLPDVLASGIMESGWHPFFVFLVLLIVYIILGSIFDTVAAMVITLPFVLPLIVGMGYSPVWWGIINVVVVEIGMITPPIGINVFVLQGVIRDYPLKTVFVGIVPFLLADIARLAILTLFPILTMWLPNLFSL
jgi:C4-dicarboxylate transporter, DctM subunit